MYVHMYVTLYHASLVHSRSLHSVTAATPWWHSLHTLKANTLPHNLQTFTKYCTYYSRTPLYKHTWKTAIYNKALCLDPNAFYWCILCKYHLNWYHKYLVHALKRNKPRPCHPHAVVAETPALRWTSVSRQRLMKCKPGSKTRLGSVLVSVLGFPLRQSCFA